MNKNFKFITGVLSLVLCFAAMAFGQRTSGNIEGTVTDPSGAVVPSVTVTAKSVGTTAGFNQTTTTNSSGYYQFPQVPAGTYEVTFVGSGFASATVRASVNIDAASAVNAQLTLTGAVATVDVMGDSEAVVDVTGTKIDNNFSKRVIEDLPTGTTFSSILKAAPNVRPELGGFQIDGASGSENVFIIDGQEVTNFRTGSLDANFNIPFETVQEVQIKSTGYEAEYGGATGGIINVVTVGGNNAFRGNFGVSFRPSQFLGQRRPTLLSYSAGGVSNLAGNVDYFRLPKDGGNDFYPVAQMSGPVLKDRLWFSAVYAPQIFETTRTIDYYSNSITGNNTNNPNGRFINNNGSITYKNKQTNEHAFFRLDAAPYSRLRMFGTFLWNPVILDGRLPASTEGLGGSPQSVNFGGAIGVRSDVNLLRQQGGRQNANAFNGQATWNPTNWMVLNFRGGRSFLNEKSTAYGLASTTRVLCSQVAGYVVTENINVGCSQGFQNVADNSQINFDVSTRTTYDVDASFIGLNAGGRHNIKVGYQMNKLFNSVDRGYADLGLIQLFYGRAINALVAVTPSAPLCTTANFPNCVYGSGLMTRFGTVGEASSTNQGLFAQDSWQIANRLTLNLGVRIEKEVVPSFGAEETSQAITFGWGDKVSPRLGAAYDLTGNGRTKIFANYGWFYDRFKYELPRGSFGGDFFRRDYFELTPARGTLYTGYNFGNILGSTPDVLGGQCPIVGGTGYSVCQADFRIATNIIGGDVFESGGIDPDIKAARQSEYTFGMEHQLARNFLLKARYTHKNVDRAVEDVGVFNDQGSEAYIIGNPGLGLVCEISTLGNYPCTKATRKYDAVEVSFDKRSTNYFVSGSYTWSRLFGNYSGLASTDEGGRNSPNVNRYFDLPPLGYTADGEPDNGLLATDRTHSFKIYGGYTLNWSDNGPNSTLFSAFTTVQSGTPLTTIYDLYALGTTVLYGRGDLGRTEMFTETDFSVKHRYRFGRDSRFTLEGFVDIRNLFDESNALGVQNSISSTAFSAPNLTLGGCTTCQDELAVFQTIFNGGGISQFVTNYLNLPATAQASRQLATYNLVNSYQAGRDVRFGFRFFF